MDYDLISELTLMDIQTDKSVQSHYFQFYALWNTYQTFAKKLCKGPP